MIKNQCEHEWEKISDLARNEQNVVKPATFLCKKCKIELTASEVFQLEALENQNETLKHLKGFQKWISILMGIIAILSLLVMLLRVENKKVGNPQGLTFEMESLFLFIILIIVAYIFWANRKRNAWDIMCFNTTLVIAVLFMIGLLENNMWDKIIYASAAVAIVMGGVAIILRGVED